MHKKKKKVSVAAGFYFSQEGATAGQLKMKELAETLAAPDWLEQNPLATLTVCE